MKKVSSFDDYAVAGRSMPLPIFFAAIAATLCGGGATIGRISFMHTTGIIVFFALTGVVINQIFSGLFISGRADQIIDLIANGVRNIHVYSMNKPEVAAAIMQNLSEIVK